MTLDRQVGAPLPAFDETVDKQTVYAQLQLWCCGDIGIVIGILTIEKADSEP
jgi:hypothetical protein